MGKDSIRTSKLCVECHPYGVLSPQVQDSGKYRDLIATAFYGDFHVSSFFFPGQIGQLARGRINDNRSEGIRLALHLGYIEDRTSPRNTGMRRGRSISFLCLPLNWCASRSISLWQQEGTP
jgi:hypothetical protein